MLSLATEIFMTPPAPMFVMERRLRSSFKWRFVYYNIKVR